MTMIFRRILGGVSWLLVAPGILVAQQATVSRNVNLRGGPSTTNPAIERLRAGATVTLLDVNAQSGFYHVKVTDGHEGWVWSRYTHVSRSTTSTQSDATAQCDAALWDHVYNPERLIVKQQCISVTGTIVDATNGAKADGVRHEADGDTHGWLDVDPEFKDLLNQGNLTVEGGNLVFEIVCKFRVTQVDAKPACPLSYHATVQIPPIGSRVRIVGTYVQETNHSKWMEIHPVTSITVIP